MTPLEFLLADLHSNRLVTVLAPSKRSDRREWDCIRVNVSVSPRWYSALCSRHTSQRAVRRGKHDTAIRRANIVRSPERMIAGQDGGIYGEELRQIAAKEFARNFPA
jgi:hypothetical protein